MQFSTVLPVAAGWLLLLSQPAVHADLHSLLRRSSPTPAQTPHPAIARVRVIESGAVSQGSGSLIGADDNYGWVITNWHVVRGATGEITVSFPGGYQSPAVVMKTDEDWDLALLAIHPPPVEPLLMATQIPVPGETLFIAGFGQGKFRLAQGECLGYAAPENGFPEEMFDVSAPARQGDSGGPIVNAQGQLVGVLFGSGHGTTTGTHVGRLRQFLADVSTELPSVATGHNKGTIAGQPMTSHRQLNDPVTPAPREVEPRAATPPSLATGSLEQSASTPVAEFETSSVPSSNQMPLNETLTSDLDAMCYGHMPTRHRAKSAWNETAGFLGFITIVAFLLTLSPRRATKRDTEAEGASKAGHL